MFEIFLIAIIGAIISAVIGTVWYSNATPMGQWHMQYLGFDKLTKAEQAEMIKEAAPKMWKTYLGQFVLSFMTSLFIGFVTSFSAMGGAPTSAVFLYVAMIWLSFTLPLIGQGMLWGTSGGSLAWKRFASDGIYNLIVYLLVALLAITIIS
jgi:hypothetical protein